MRASWTKGRSICLGLLLLALGCADGGVGGTGISTIQGNVVGGGEGIVVREIVTGAQGETDETGSFRFEGPIAGETTIQFFPQNDSTPKTTELFVPSRSEVTLSNVRFTNGTAEAERIEVNVRGFLASDASCDQGVGSFEFRDEDGLVFLVLVNPETDITRDLSCEDLLTGFQIRLIGTEKDLDITADRIIVLTTVRAESAE
jgi:hypothetical protein